MSNQSSSIQTFPIYRLYFDDIEEIFLNQISMQSLIICAVPLCLLTLANLVILIYRSSTIFLACLIPCIYSLLIYDFLQFTSIILLKYNLLHINQKSFGELCRWPYYLKASAEAGQCLTLLLLFVVRRQKLRYFLKHRHLANSSGIHTRALILVTFLFIVYVNNWITHLKVEKIHLITSNESNNEINIQEYPVTLYGGSSTDWKLKDHRQFYIDLERYASYQSQLSSSIPRNRTSKPDKIIHNRKDDSIHEIIIKIPYNNIYAPRKPLSSSSSTISSTTMTTTSKNRTRRRKYNRRLAFNRTFSQNNSYRIHRCTYGQRNFFFANLITMIHALIYLIFLSYFLTTVYRQQIPPMTVAYHRKLCDRALAMGRKKSAERHQQLILLTHLRHFQYLIVYGHTLLTLIRLLYICSLTIILWFIQSPFQWVALKIFFYALFLIVYYSIPLRILLLFLYLFCTLFSSYIYSIFYYMFHTKLHFSCQLEKPSIRFRLHLTPYSQHEIHLDEHSTNSFMVDLTSSVYDEHSTVVHNESFAFYEETTTSTSQAGIVTNVVAMIHPSEAGKTVI